jgi:hypothetical protein
MTGAGALALVVMVLVLTDRAAFMPKVDLPQHTVRGPDGLTAATALQVDGSAQVVVMMTVAGSPGGSGVFAASCRHEDLVLEWLDADTVRITYPSKVVPEKRNDSAFFSGRTIRCVYSTR